MGKVATIILNRNLPDVTDRLCDSLNAYDGDVTDVYVVEAGSDDDKLSKHCTWHANWDQARENGLRYPRGMNYGLSELFKGGKYHNYDYFFLLTNDTEFSQGSVIKPLLEVLAEHPRVGLISPCSKRWGERLLLQETSTKYFSFIHNTSYLLRKKFIDQVIERNNPDFMNFLYDGTNFRGYGTEFELIAKAYANDWAAAITTKVWAEENESHLLNKHDLIKTEGYEENRELYLKEGQAWMKRKYGFNSRWSMQMYINCFYNNFFEFHPEYEQCKI